MQALARHDTPRYTTGTMARDHIRTPQSRERERIAKRKVLPFLNRKGFNVRNTRNAGGRFLVEVTDPQGRPRTLWFKLGWKPSTHETSAVQIAMLKKKYGRAPSKLTAVQVAKEVAEKKFSAEPGRA